MRTLVSALALLLLDPSAFAGHVLVVGPNPGQLHTLQDAVTMANDGDVILVKSGSYTSVRITGKAVAVVEDVNQTVTISGAVRVRDLTSQQHVVLSGLLVNGQRSISVPELMSGLFAANCAGDIVVQDAQLFGSTPMSGPCIPYLPRGGTDLTNCRSVSLARCTLKGNVDFWTSPTPDQNGPGLAASSNCDVSMNDVTCTGGFNSTICSSNYDATGSSGGNGVNLSGSSLFAADCILRGADGTNITTPPSFTTLVGLTSGGSGLVGVGTTTSPVTLLGTTLTFGFGYDCSGALNCDSGGPGVPQYGSLNVQTLPGPGDSRLSGPNIVRDNQLADFSVAAQPGERVELAVSRAPTFEHDVATGCILHVKDPNWIVAGLVPAGSDHVSRRYHMPNLAIANPATVFYVQARVTSPLGVQRLTNVQAVVLVDASY